MACGTKKRGKLCIDFRDQHGKRRLKTLPKGTSMKEAKTRLEEIKRMVAKETFLGRSEGPAFSGIAEAVEFVRRHPRVAAAVGTPPTIGEPEGEVPTGTGPAQANLDLVVSGPDGIARVDLVMARMGRRWEVLTATLVAEGERVSLREGQGEADS